MTTLADVNEKVVDRRHPEWEEFNVRWRWLADSFEGGDRYRFASYGLDYRSLPRNNLVRHKREYPDPRSTIHGSDVAVSSSMALSEAFGPSAQFQRADQTDDFGVRQMRTPVPGFVRDAIEGHLSQIYAREVHRVGPESLTAWWKDVDGSGVEIDRWLRETVAPLLLVLGQIDLAFDLPVKPPGEDVVSRADELRLGLGRPLASYILPENMLWWTLDRASRYVECLVQEHTEEGTRFRHWTAETVSIYDGKGDHVETVKNEIGFVPIVRIFDRRRARCRNVGLSRYEGVAEQQREYYNRDSELILSDSTQAHPLLQGPEDFVQADGTVPIGPSWMLPKKKDVNGTTTRYEGFEVIEFPKDGAESIRRNKADIREAIDRATHQIKPAGATGTNKGTTEQSGISKAIDYQPAHNALSQISASLQRCEYVLSELAMRVAGDEVDEGEIDIVYPTNFDLYTSSDVATALSDFQVIACRTGMEGMEASEALMLGRLWRLCMPGLTDDQYKASDAEVAAFIAAGGGMKQQIDMQALTAGTPAGNAQSSASDTTNRLQPAGKGGGNPNA